MLILAATDTTSRVLCRTLHLLALHPEIQRDLRAELRGCAPGPDYDALDALRDRENCVAAFLKFRGHGRLDVGLLLENKARQERDNFFGLVCRERVFENKFGEDALVGGVDLRAR